MRHLTTWILTLTVAAVAAPGLTAQERPEAGDWLPWTGCWEPADDQAEASAEMLVCFRSAVDGVEVTTLLDGETVGVERILADGIQRPASEGGCEGTREARWSDDGRRVFLTSELECAAGVTRTSTGVFALAENGQRWVEIHASRATADQDPVLTVQRFRPASAATLARHEVTAPEADRPLAVATTRSVAASPLTEDDVVEAVEVAGSEVASALILEMGQPFELNAGVLRNLRDRGVPTEVLDMMVALTWPDRFEIDGMEPQRAVAAVERHPSDRARAAWPGPTRMSYRMRFGCVGYGVWCYDPFFYGFYGRSFYGSGFGFGYGWGPGFIVRGPLVVRERSGRMTPDGPRISGSPAGTRPARLRDGGARAPAEGSARPAPASRPTTTNRPANARPSNHRPSTTRPARPATTRPSSGRPSTSRPSTTRPARPANTRPSNNRPSGNNERPARPTGGNGSGS